MIQVPSAVYHVVLYGLLVVAFIAVTWLRVRPRPVPPPSGEVPTATIVQPTWRRRLARWAPWILLAGSLFGACFLFMHSYEIVIVSDDAGGIDVRRTIAVGHQPSFAIAPGAPAPIADRDNDWVVNRSSRSVRVEHFAYGLGMFNRDPDTVPPGTAVTVLDLEYVGPSEKPPASITSDSAIEFRDWLTW